MQLYIDASMARMNELGIKRTHKAKRLTASRTTATVDLEKQVELMAIE